MSQPILPAPSFLNEDESKIQVSPTQNPALYWWRNLGGHELESLIDTALLTSPKLQIAAQKVIQARAQKNQSRSMLLPDLRARAGYDISAPRGGLGSVEQGGQLTSRRAYQAVLEGRWTLDFFDERSAFAQAAAYQYARALYEYEQTLSETIESITRSYINYLALNDRIKNARENEQIFIEMQEIIKKLYEFGETTIVELHLQDSSRRNSQVVIPTLIQEREQKLNEIALLTGISADRINLTQQGLDAIKLNERLKEIDSGVVLKRPDVLALEMAMEAASANLRVARAKVLPQFNLAANIGSGSRHISEIFQPHTLLWGFIAEASASIFDAGRIKEDINYNDSVYLEVVEAYTYAIYSGLIEIRNNITSISSYKERLELQALAVDSAFLAKKFSLESYLAGGIGFLTYLDVVKNYTERKDDLIIYQQQHMEKWIDFYASIGGGVPGFSEYEENRLNALKKNESDSVELTDTPYAIEFIGIYNYLGIESALKKVAQQTHNEDQSLVAISRVREKQPHKNDFNLQASDWYNLYLTGFSTAEDAEKTCQVFLADHWRCRSISYSDGKAPSMTFHVNKKQVHPVLLYDFNSDTKEKDIIEQEIAVKEDAAKETVEKEAAEEIKEAAVEQLAKTKHEDKNNHSAHHPYSLITTNGKNALIIGNNTYRTWEVEQGDLLQFNGVVDSINEDYVVLKFDNKEVVLYPVAGDFISETMTLEERTQAIKKHLSWVNMVKGLYSLIAVDSHTAWLIGNNSYRVWSVKKGDGLHHQGIVEEIGDNYIGLNFNGVSFQLKPIYSVEIIDPGQEALLTWHGTRSESGFNHKVRSNSWIYGGGVVEKIDNDSIHVVWSERQAIRIFSNKNKSK